LTLLVDWDLTHGAESQANSLREPDVS